MSRALARKFGLIVLLAVPWLGAPSAHADGDLGKVNHIIIVMQENHSFDNYFGVLPLAPKLNTMTGVPLGLGPYHNNNSATGSNGGCPTSDHLCVDGLNCTRDALGNYTCANSNVEDDGSTQVFSFHDTNYCVAPDVDHSWLPSHLEGNYSSPNLTFGPSPNDGFVRVNDRTEQHDSSTGETPTDDDTMGFYDERDLAYYYALAQTFAIDDRYFCDVVGPTIPNRFYLMAATSFGHLTTTVGELFPPFNTSGRFGPGSYYQPINGTIFDLLDNAGVSWVDYFSDLPQAGDFRDPASVSGAGHFKAATTPPGGPPADFFVDASTPGCGLPRVALVDPILVGSLGNNSTDEHPPHDIRAGQKFVSQVVDAVRNGPCWTDSIVFINYAEHGGFYDHVAPAIANQNGAMTPDGIFPGQCADASNPMGGSENAGGGQQCSDSRAAAASLCGAPYIPTGTSGFTPTGPYPAYCAAFDTLGFRVPFIAVSPFSKPQYVSHTTGDHTSLLALIEKRFLNGKHLNARDGNANTLEDMFDFDHSLSAGMSVSSTLAPEPDLVLDGNGSCTESSGLPGVPF